MTAYILISYVVLVVGIALALWILHKKITVQLQALTSYTALQSLLVTRAVKDHTDKVMAHTERFAMALSADVVAETGKVQAAVTSGKEHVTAEVSKVAADVRTHAAQAVHEAIGTVRGVKHETCQICGKVANIWKIVDGKVECADCSIRKLVS